MKTMLLTLFILSNFLYQPSPHSETNQSATATEISSPKLEYPDNQRKSFVEVDAFYKKLDKDIYEEYKNATFSMRKKVSFKEVPDVELTFKIKTKLDNKKMNPIDSTIHPNRQVYFLASFHQNEKEEFHKYVVIDAETKTVLLKGNHYHLYENPYK
ncbi:hypothetical protein WAX74_15000 [Psychrobacillus sp. FJAT-51614]|uniref:Uncharacterized protein n=1 Tax=Psychrobacillus mangrovi TaxID=3117745 RepID=A0ABU8F7D8_9BACI